MGLRHLLLATVVAIAPKGANAQSIPDNLFSFNIDNIPKLHTTVGIHAAQDYLGCLALAGQEQAGTANVCRKEMERLVVGCLGEGYGSAQCTDLVKAAAIYALLGPPAHPARKGRW